MNVLVNALSVNNLSGRHVLLGHLRQLLYRADVRCRFGMLYHDRNVDMQKIVGDLPVEWIRCPGQTVQWPVRYLWEQRRLSRVAEQFGASLIFTPSGIAASGLKIPQVVMAQNPWCLVPEIHRNIADKFKAALQRRAYHAAMKNAAMMIFNSEYMRQAYRKNAGFNEKKSEIVYQGIEDQTHEIAGRWRISVSRKQDQILCVSVMASHKGVETLVSAVAGIRRRKIPARLLLVGAWPDRGYEMRIRSLVENENIQNDVEFKGHVSTDQLHRHYAESRVFCLMSRCESFGIPAVEAQAFGTPVVSSNCCAIPEVCGSGGIYPEPGDVEATADALEMMLTDSGKWKELSHLAIQNAQKYRWENCSKPLLKVFGLD